MPFLLSSGFIEKEMYKKISTSSQDTYNQPLRYVQVAPNCILCTGMKTVYMHTAATAPMCRFSLATPTPHISIRVQAVFTVDIVGCPSRVEVASAILFSPNPHVQAQ